MAEPPASPPPFPDTLEVVIEVPRGGFIKRKDDGSIDYISPLPSPFNYGSVPNTLSGDGDREDALVLGPQLLRGATVRVPVVARVRFVDAGLPDPKWVCSHGPLSAQELRRVVGFFTFYARTKTWLNALRGKPSGTRFEGIDQR